MSTTQQPEALQDLRERLRGLEADHTPNGWPAVRMREISALLDDLDNARSDNQVLRLGYAAARLEIESLRGRSVAPAGEYPALPAGEASSFGDYKVFDADQMRAYVDADRAMRAAQPAGAQQPGADPELLKFYGVATDSELIAAQARHIERLQAKLPQTPSFAPQRVREG